MVTTIPVTLFKSGEVCKEFVSLQECFRYLRNLEELISLNDKQIYDIINAGLDDGKPWNEYEFKTTEEIRLSRLDRKTR